MTMAHAAKVETPELDKRAKILETANEIGHFLDWLGQEKGYVLCEPDPNSRHGKYVPSMFGGFEQLLADYFEINLAVVEQERRALLEALQEPEDVPGGDSAP